ncbi:integral membrane protein [Mycolicibacterium mageritense DSM 44476 = CIP 104973]|uniref:Membrane protein n=1 Tax=Mycolicibacterium mageritense TaxID=53462 RepID=A0ABM7HW79_MYCME|nr:hypothetical protein [Mycolicibacterium mageritense]MCC9183057.1 hypothetical protein [Mycolicibacterium mageritense]BBX34863.1 membrane protein [Mycolicibacterium mageritense]CDO20618.1 integral membrane protein [Mycolicibacterium mageritense DSM 44476 = CIP 104973]
MVNEPAVRVDRDALVLGPVQVSFQRTLRIPESGLHPLPPGLGRFPLRRVQDYPDTAPAEWLAHGGIMLPVYQREAMWLSFHADEPAALQVGVGKVCAVSGKAWRQRLTRRSQNYVALPRQPWLDGINAGDGFIRQFVAVPLGCGATVEGQVTGEERHGGVQLRAVGLTAEALAKWRAERSAMRECMVEFDDIMPAPAGMGLGAGGRMRQEVYRDERDLSDYDEQRCWRVFVHLCSAAQWTAITGEVPPPTPVDRDSYVEAGLPWFDYYDSDAADLAPSVTLAQVKTVGDVLGKEADAFQPVDPATVIALKDAGADVVTDGKW